HAAGDAGGARLCVRGGRRPLGRRPVRARGGRRLRREEQPADGAAARLEPLISMPRAGLLGCVCATLAVACGPTLSAQQWGLDLYAGGTQPQGVAAQVRSTSLVGNLRWQGTSAFGYGTVGAPLDENGALWSAAGGGGRWTLALAPRWEY